ncbi:MULTISPECIES: hypothetical protein [Halomicrobium]|uniref:Histidine kinase n=2 Tax=Halomicrobium mukohataei TaxID=57705 RepID=C7P0Q3_HALMD|nr:MULTISPECIES: hypothetical protein [Halomicrobium]ACV47035.1 conserved hypothetical protein [Halomicrobium mukohataei DSM 12286]QCD65525.1 hypothetical protein E5139_07695 [Halomicrobium mukohataei]QFR20331.1 hypothetical protein GBQ70_07690 [Halomicrobium sp. ZPS1]
MASETPASSVGRDGTPAVSSPWVRGLAAGLIGGLETGVFLTVAAPAVLSETFPALVFASGPVVGWLVLAVASAAAGIVFTTVVERQALSTTVVLGIGYSVALWLVAAVALPTWLGAVGATAPPFPWFDPTLLAGLALYGIVLGIGHWLFGR